MRQIPFSKFAELSFSSLRRGVVGHGRKLSLEERFRSISIDQDQIWLSKDFAHSFRNSFRFNKTYRATLDLRTRGFNTSLETVTYNIVYNNIVAVAA